jgi:mRNA-degrading endonuclease RelE of RelBE toxin-antitoxin system
LEVKRILTTPAFERSLRKHSDTDIESIRRSISQLPDAFGAPHRHAGIGIRKLRKNVYELRVGLKVRVLFTSDENDLVLLLVGNHDAVAKWVKGK